MYCFFSSTTQYSETSHPKRGLTKPTVRSSVIFMIRLPSLYLKEYLVYSEPKKERNRVSKESVHAHKKKSCFFSYKLERFIEKQYCKVGRSLLWKVSLQRGIKHCPQNLSIFPGTPLLYFLVIAKKETLVLKLSF